MEVLRTIQVWSYPIIDLLLLIYCLTKSRYQGVRLFAIGFGITLVTSLSWRLVDVLDLYTKYDNVYALLGHISFLSYIAFAGLFAMGISQISTLSELSEEKSMQRNLGKMPPSQILLSLDGRINRGKFWAYILPLNFVWLVGLMIDFSTKGEPGAFYSIGILISLWPSIALNVKRCHDRDKSGWFYLVALIPLVNLWYLIEAGFLKGTEGDNRFGPDPLSQTDTTNPSAP